MIKFRPDGVSPARYMAVMGLLFAVMSSLNLVENVFSAFLPAGIRIGLSNIVIMAVIAGINLPSALLLTILKALFVLLTRGVTAGAISLCGTLLTFAATALLIKRTDAGYVLISVISALAHSLGQLLAARLLLESNAVFGYAPILGAGSVITGICTGIILGAVFPQLERVLQHKNNR